MKECGLFVSVYLSVHMFQLENCRKDFDKMWHGPYATGGTQHTDRLLLAHFLNRSKTAATHKIKMDLLTSKSFTGNVLYMDTSERNKCTFNVTLVPKIT
jgi:hypothetical protein